MEQENQGKQVDVCESDHLDPSHPFDKHCHVQHRQSSEVDEKITEDDKF